MQGNHRTERTCVCFQTGLIGCIFLVVLEVFVNEGRGFFG